MTNSATGRPQSPRTRKFQRPRIHLPCELQPILWIVGPYIHYVLSYIYYILHGGVYDLAWQPLSFAEVVSSDFWHSLSITNPQATTNQSNHVAGSGITLDRRTAEIVLRRVANTLTATLVIVLYGWFQLQKDHGYILVSPTCRLIKPIYPAP